MGTVRDFVRVWRGLSYALRLPPALRPDALREFWATKFRLMLWDPHTAPPPYPLASWLHDSKQFFWLTLAPLYRVLDTHFPGIAYPALGPCTRDGHPACPPNCPDHLLPPVIPEVLWAQLGWPISDHPRAKHLVLSNYSVKLGTRVLSLVHDRSRQEAHRTYISLALTLGWRHDPALLPSDWLRHLRASFRLAWSLPWDNKHKEVFWRLAVDGIPGCSSRTVWTCPCCPCVAPLNHTRAHAFWDCPIAASVLDILQSELGAWAPSLTNRPAASGLRSRLHQPVSLSPSAPPVVGPPFLLSRAAVWLCRPPLPSIHAGVWCVVCLAAIAAMDHGRRTLYRLLQRHGSLSPAHLSGPRQRTLFQVWGHASVPAPPQSIVATACLLAQADFWGRLHSFVSLGMAPAQWAAGVGPCHPFLSHAGRRLSPRAPFPVDPG